MKILTSVLLAGILFCGHQATAKESPPDEKIGNWKYTIQYDEMNDSPKYMMAVNSDEGDSVVFLQCFPATSTEPQLRSVVFFTVEGFSQDDDVSHLNFQARVDSNKPFSNKLKLGKFLGKDILITNSDEVIDNFSSQLKSGNKLTVKITTIPEDNFVTSEHFHINGFEKALQKIINACQIGK